MRLNNELYDRRIRSCFACHAGGARFMICEFIATLKCRWLMVAERGPHGAATY